MIIFIIQSIKLDCLTLHQFVRGVMNPSLTLLSVLETLRTDPFIHLMISKRDLTDLAFANLQRKV